MQLDHDDQNVAEYFQLILALSSNNCNKQFRRYIANGVLYTVSNNAIQVSSFVQSATSGYDSTFLYVCI